MTNPAKTITLTTTSGDERTVRVICWGDNYGRNNVLTHSKSDPMVEFAPGIRYYLRTLTGECKYGGGDCRATGLYADKGLNFSAAEITRACDFAAECMLLPSDSE